MKKSIAAPTTNHLHRATPQKKEARKAPQFKQATVAEGCPYHGGNFNYGCYICNPR